MTALIIYLLLIVLGIPAVIYYIRSGIKRAKQQIDHNRKGSHWYID